MMLNGNWDELESNGVKEEDFVEKNDAQRPEPTQKIVFWIFHIANEILRLAGNVSDVGGLESFNMWDENIVLKPLSDAKA